MTEAVPIRPAATVLLVRDGDAGLEVFMVVRHHQIDFASGALVFPGGKVEDEDSVIASDPLRSGAAGELSDAERAFRVAALRETFEECGVLLARPRGGASLLDGARLAEIMAKSEGRSFGRMLDEENLELALDSLTLFAHWITPPFMPKRFDTKFYIVAAPGDQIALHDGSESVDSVWINPTEALTGADVGKYTLVLVTKLNVQMLGESATAASAIEVSKARRVVCVRPVGEKTADGFKLTIPADAGYAGTVFSM